MNDHPDGSPTKDTIDVECNTNIRRLTVRAGILPQLASYVKYLLSRLSAQNIQQITFVVLSGDAGDWQGWNEVDQVLDDIKFRGLKEIAIVVNPDQDMDIIRQRLTDRFPSMYSKGILAIRGL
jgi:hypothetical protein